MTACLLPPAAAPPPPLPGPQVDAQRQRFSVALKQSLCGSRDAAYLQSLFRCARSLQPAAARTYKEVASIDG